MDDFRIYARALTQEQIQMAMNPPQEPEPAWPDVDEDGDVDCDDFAWLQRCLTDSDGLGFDEENCGRFDRDEDLDVDTLDVAKFIDCGTGPDVPFDPENPPVGCGQ